MKLRIILCSDESIKENCGNDLIEETNGIIILSALLKSIMTVENYVNFIRMFRMSKGMSIAFDKMSQHLAENSITFYINHRLFTDKFRRQKEKDKKEDPIENIYVTKTDEESVDTD